MDFWGIVKVTGAVAIVRVPIYARLVRGSVLSIKEKEYIEACRALGQRDPLVLLRHILPNCLAPIIVAGTLERGHGDHCRGVPELPRGGRAAANTELGLGSQGECGRGFKRVPWLALCPGFAIFITVLSFNLFGDGMRDALDPRLK